MDFDEELAHRPIRFIEKFCKPSKGANNQLILQPWQHFIIGSLFGWVHKETKLRRFKEALVFVGRKMVKQRLFQGLLTMVCRKMEKMVEIHMLANTMKQARLLFDESKAMIKASPVLKKNFRSLRDAIHYDKTISKIEPQASDSEKLDGLNTHIGILMKYTNLKIINLYQSLKTQERHVYNHY